MSVIVELKVPDVGNVPEIDVVEVTIKPGDSLAVDQTVATLETDKASMELPSTTAGVVKEVFIKKGDKVSEGVLIATVEVAAGQAAAAPDTAGTIPGPAAGPAPGQPETKPKPEVASLNGPASVPVAVPSGIEEADAAPVHASPSVRLFARELGVDVGKITQGTGRKGRILREDVTAFVKKTMSGAAPGSGAVIPGVPAVDFSQFGQIEIQKLSKIKHLTGQNLTRVWLNVPLVTYHDEADITELEAFRNGLNAEKAKDEVKLTALLFIIKALVAAMRQFPSFNASLSSDGESLVLKKYCHIGIAVDTPKGLVVPVLRDADKKSINELSLELAEKSAKARQGKLMPADMQGGCITISSLGGIGGTAFTPIVNAPEVAILGVTRHKMQPVWNGAEFIPRLMLPLDLTYDHRVVDGAEGARFMNVIKQNLGDIRRLLL